MGYEIPLHLSMATTVIRNKNGNNLMATTDWLVWVGSSLCKTGCMCSRTSLSKGQSVYWMLKRVIGDWI